MSYKGTHRSTPMGDEERLQRRLAHLGKHYARTVNPYQMTVRRSLGFFMSQPHHITKTHPSWNKGLTAETDERVRLTRLHNIGMPNPLKPDIFAKRLEEKELKFGVNRGEFEKLYLEQFLTVNEIGVVLNIPPNRAYDLLRRYNIPRRTHRETMLLRPDLYENWHKNTASAAIVTFARLYKEPGFIKRRFEGIYNSNRNRIRFGKPNKVECKLLDIIVTNEFPYKYVGDGSFVIGTCNPDFISTDNSMKIIEFFGNYWHKGEDPNIKIQYFKQFGYDTMVIWERELNNPQDIVNRIRAF